MSEDSPKFEEWIHALFGAPVQDYPGDLSHYEVAIPSRLVELEYYHRLFDKPSEVLEGFSADQIGQGLDYLINGMYQSYTPPYLDPKLPAELQLETIRNIENIFTSIFATKCELSSPEYSDSKRLNQICYMWWDVFPSWGAPEPQLELHHREILSVMERTLKLNSLACIRSALHGLNHWVPNHSKRVHQIIDNFLRESGRKLPKEILAEAQSAKKGTIQ